MASITAAAGGGNWTAGATWVGGVAPTAADDAKLDNTSGNVTADAGSVCRSLDCTGYTGILTIANSATALAVGDGSGGAFTLVAAMTVTISGGSAIITFKSTSNNSGTGWGITSAGKTLPECDFSGVGGKWVLQDALNLGTQDLNLISGTLDTNSLSVTAGRINRTTTGNAFTLTLGASALSLSTNGNPFNVNSTNLTVTANTAIATFTSTTTATFLNTQSNFDWGGLSIVHSGTTLTVNAPGNKIGSLTRTGTATTTDSITFSGNFIINGKLTATGNSTTNRLSLKSSVGGTPRYVTCRGPVELNNFSQTDVIIEKLRPLKARRTKLQAMR